MTAETLFSADIMIYLVTLAASFGTLLWRVKELEKKMEKHNNLVERMATVEGSYKALHERLDSLDKKLAL